MENFAAGRGGVTSWSIILAAFRRERSWYDLQFEAWRRQALVELNARNQEWLHVVSDGAYCGAVGKVMCSLYVAASKVEPQRCGTLQDDARLYQLPCFLEVGFWSCDVDVVDLDDKK